MLAQHENHSKSRGVNQRNKALEHIEQNRIEGIVYFFDDDNTYTPEVLFPLHLGTLICFMPFQ